MPVETGIQKSLEMLNSRTLPTTCGDTLRGNERENRVGQEVVS